MEKSGNFTVNLGGFIMRKKRIAKISGSAIVFLLMLVVATTFIACNDGRSDDQGDGGALVVTLDRDELDLTVGDTFTLVADVNVEGVAVSWNSSNTEIVTVDKGVVTAVSAGTATVTASAGSAQDICTVNVTDRQSGGSAPIITEEEQYEGELYINNNTPAASVDLTKGLSASDGNGVELPIVVTDDGGFDISKLGTYTVTYSATDAEGRTATFERSVYVTYFGIAKEFIDAQAVSELTSWTYVADNDEDKTAMEWKQQVVPGHSPNWNLFEGPAGMPYIVMRGSDTFGRAGTDGVNPEVDDEDPNTILWNKVTVGENSTFRIFASNNPYPDYNNLLSKFRVSVICPDDYTDHVVMDYVEIKAPLNDEGTGLDYDTMRTGTYFDVDLSDYVGQTIILLIEQDAPADVYQEEYYLDIGYKEFQLEGLIQECRDSLVVYSMAFVAAEEQVDVSALTLDTATSWGDPNQTDWSAWGLRGDIAAKAKWTTVFLNGAEGQVGYKDVTGGSLQIIAREPADGHDGGAFVRDAVTMNKVTVSENYFVIYVGTDSDNTNVNYRLTFLVDGVEHNLAPMWTVPGFKLYKNRNWGNLQISQWVSGAKLTYDVSAFKGKEAVIMIEQDENRTETDAGACTLWFNFATFTAEVTTEPADYAAYDELAAELDGDSLDASLYTDVSWARYEAAVTAFENLSRDLNADQQGYIDAAIAAVRSAKEQLELKDAPVVDIPDSTITGTLASPIGSFDDADWKALEIDGSKVWGTDEEDFTVWGLRGDTTAKAKWKHFLTGDGQLNYVGTLGASLQSIAWESGNDTAEDLGADAVFVNRVWVQGNMFSVWVGCDNVGDGVNVRVRLLLEDGTIVTLTPETNADFVAVRNGWGKISVSQWTTGTELVFDVSEYNGEVLTVLIEQDFDETTTQTGATMWLNKVVFGD